MIMNLRTTLITAEVIFLSLMTTQHWYIGFKKIATWGKGKGNIGFARLSIQV
jgi:hypothetical protein